jgi:glycosyltransferase involved in cell wall biosynthesis
MNTPKFSFALIARNEALTLPRLIGSLKEFQSRGGEIWVLDTGSTDDTVEVAKSLGCKVEAVGDKFRIQIDKDLADKINTKFVVEGEAPVVNAGESLFDFASARNYISTFPSNDFIFTPDCDEIFTKFDIDKIDECINNGIEQLEYNFVFSHDSFGNPAIKFSHCKAYDRRKLHWEGVIHEILTGQARRQFLGEDVVYLEHYQNEKTNRTGYLKGLALDCYNNPTNDRNSHYFARECLYTGRFKTAIKEFKNHITMNGWIMEAATSMMFIGDCEMYLGNTDEMLKWYMKSVDHCPERREPLMRLAEYYFKKGKHSQVIIFSEAALAIKETPFYSNDEKYYRDYPHSLLYVSYWWTGNKLKSYEHWKKALAFCPTNPKYISDGSFYTIFPKVCFVIPTLGREEGLERCIESIKKLNYPEDKITIEIMRDSFENRVGVPKLLAQGIKQTNADWIVFASNDTEFTPESINEALKVGEKGFVSFNTGELLPDSGNRSEHFMIRKDIIEKIGEVFDTEFYHCGVDNLLAAKMDKLGIFVRAEKAIVNHYHFSKGSEYDETYQLGWAHVEEDRELLKKKLEELNKV